jgi:hypothetical protein
MHLLLVRLINMKTELELQNQFYQTADLALSAVISLNYPLECIDKTDPRKVLFLFKRDEGLDQLIESFWRGVLKVEPQAYFNQLKAIKSRIYARE